MYTATRLYLREPESWIEPIEDVVADFNQSHWLPLHNLPDEALLYHYTDARGLYGIVTSQQLWCSDAGFVNDAQEIQYGLGLIDRIITSLIDEPDRSENSRRFLKNTRVWVRSHHRVFIACFCEKPNLLSQWKTYADRGGGYVLGFGINDNTKTLTVLGGQKEWQKPFFRRVIYCLDEQTRLARLYLTEICSVRDTVSMQSHSISEFDEEMIWSSIALGVSDTLIDMAMTFKHPGFEEEKEWRLVRGIRKDMVPKHCHIRPAGSYVLPYAETLLVESSAKVPNELEFPLRYVGYGPTLDPERAKIGVDLLLNKANLDASKIVVRGHDIPYRTH